MKLLLSVASVAYLLFLSHFHDACAAGPYDGEWTGSATATSGRCKPAIVTLMVLGTVVTGQARLEIDAPNINGTVREDGTIGATIGWQPLIGKFIDDGFEGTFKNGDCVWKMLLKRAK
jgi:hypothetical protein